MLLQVSNTGRISTLLIHFQIAETSRNNKLHYFAWLQFKSKVQPTQALQYKRRNSQSTITAYKANDCNVLILSIQLVTHFTICIALIKLISRDWYKMNNAMKIKINWIFYLKNQKQFMRWQFWWLRNKNSKIWRNSLNIV